MSPPLIVRELKVEDAGLVRSIASNCQPLLLNGVYVNIFLAKYVGNICFVLEEQGIGVGFVTGFRSTLDPDVFFLWQLGIDPKSRGKGYSTILIAAVFKAAKSIGCTHAQFSISPENRESLGTFMSYAKRNNKNLIPVGEEKYKDPLSGKMGHEIFYELAI